MYVLCSYITYPRLRAFDSREKVHTRKSGPRLFLSILEMSPALSLSDRSWLGRDHHQWLVFGVMDMSVPADRHNIYKSGPLLPTNFSQTFAQMESKSA